MLIHPMLYGITIPILYGVCKKLGEIVSLSPSPSPSLHVLISVLEILSLDITRGANHTYKKAHRVPSAGLPW